jgi:hypothetical protein
VAASGRGAIFNNGTLVLHRVEMVDNTAEGGSFSYQAVAGGGIGQDASSFAIGGGFGGQLPGAVGVFAATGGPAREGQGGGAQIADGSGGFGGGGAGAGGDGGFGGGGGEVATSRLNPRGLGLGGFGGGNGGSDGRGGGGAALGGAIFNRGGVVIATNSAFRENRAHGGDGLSVHPYSGAGSAFGGAIFNLNGSVTLIHSALANNRLDGGSGFGGRTDGYQVYNLAYGGASKSDGNTVVARLDLGGTWLRGAPRDRHDLVNQTFLIAPYKSEAIVADAPDIRELNGISTAPANFDGNFVDGVSGSPGRGVVSVTFERLDTVALKSVAAEVERTVMNLERTHNRSFASARLTDLASKIPHGLQQLAPVWQQDLAGYNAQTPGSWWAIKRQLLADLKHEVAAGVAAGEFRLTGPGAAAYLSSAELPQASLDSVTIFNSTGFGITVSASLSGTGRTLPYRSIANSTSSQFDFESSANNFISINVSRTGSSQPPQANFTLSRPISGYSGKQFTVSVFGGRFSVSI